jgi:hypothetical protein
VPLGGSGLCSDVKVLWHSRLGLRNVRRLGEGEATFKSWIM